MQTPLLDKATSISENENNDVRTVPRLSEPTAVHRFDEILQKPELGDIWSIQNSIARKEEQGVYYVSGYVCGEPVQIMVDEGCSKTCINPRIFAQIPVGKRPPMTEASVALQGIGNNPLDVRGEAEITLTIHGRRAITSVAVVGELERANIDFILGNDTTGTFNFWMRAFLNQCYWVDETDPIPAYKAKVSYTRGRFAVKNSLVVPKNSSMMVPVKLEGHPQEHQLLAEMIPTWPHSNVVVVRGVIDPTVTNRYSMEVRNLNDYEVALEQGEFIATLTPVTSIEDLDTPTEQDRVGFINLISSLIQTDPTSVEKDRPGMVQNVMAAKAAKTNSSTPRPSSHVSEGIPTPSSQRKAFGKSIEPRFDDNPNAFPLDDDVETESASPSVATSLADSLPEHMRMMIEGMEDYLSEAEILLVVETLREYQDTFQAPDEPLGRTDEVQHGIDVQGHPPIKQAPRRLPYHKEAIVKEELQKMLDQDLIRPSSSPWASPIVLVTKKDGTTRFCIDYRHLNDVTRKDAFPLPRIDESLDTLAGAKYFCTLDLASGYWQVGMTEQDRDKTAFCTKFGLYEFNVMPFGLSNAPATFERLTEKMLAGMQWEECLVYIDDVIVFGRTFSEVLMRLRKVLQRLRDFKLKLKPKKCDLFKKKVKFLGHVVSEEGVECDPDKINSVKNWTIPANVTEVRSFLGLCNYYRKFIRNFSNMSYEMVQLTKKDIPLVWTDECQKSFDSLKHALINAPVLAYPDLKKEFILDTDASGTGIGAVLSQLQDDGSERPIAYGSYTLNKSQSRYCTTNRELLAVVVFEEHYRQYLAGHPFRIRTDHASLIWLKRFKDPEGILARWLMRLECYDFKLEFRAGAQHGNADSMSRRVNAPPICKAPRLCKFVQCTECGPFRTAEQWKKLDIIDPDGGFAFLINAITRSQTKRKNLPLRKSKRIASRIHNAIKQQERVATQKSENQLPEPNLSPQPKEIESSAPQVMPLDAPRDLAPEEHPLPVVDYKQFDEEIEAISNLSNTDTPLDQPKSTRRSRRRKGKAYHPASVNPPKTSTIPTELPTKVEDSKKEQITSGGVSSRTRSAKAKQALANAELELLRQVNRALDSDPGITDLLRRAQEVVDVRKDKSIELIAEESCKEDQTTRSAETQKHARLDKEIELIQETTEALKADPSDETLRNNAFEVIIGSEERVQDIISDESLKELLEQSIQEQQKDSESLPSKEETIPKNLAVSGQSEESLTPTETAVPQEVEKSLKATLDEGRKYNLRPRKHMGDQKPEPPSQEETVEPQAPALPEHGTRWSKVKLGIKKALAGVGKARKEDSVPPTAPPPAQEPLPEHSEEDSDSDSFVDLELEPPPEEAGTGTNNPAPASEPEEAESEDSTHSESSEDSNLMEEFEELNLKNVQEEIKRDENVYRRVSNWLKSWPEKKLKQEQLKDKELKLCYKWVQKGERPPSSALGQFGSTARAIWAQWPDMYLKNGILCRVLRDPKYPEPMCQIVAPSTIRREIFKALHKDILAGHLGQTKTLEAVRSRFYWPHHRRDIKLWCKKCRRCQENQGRPMKRSKVPLTQKYGGVTFERVAFDILSMVKSKKGNTCILMITDYFSKWAEAIPLPKHDARTIAEAFNREWICKYGTPRILHSDRGPELTGSVMNAVYDLLEIDKTQTTPYRPQSNGQCERQNRTCCRMLRAFALKWKVEDWDDLLPYVMSGYRRSVHETTKVTPNRMVFGRECNLPIDLMFGWAPERPKCPIEFVETMGERFIAGHEIGRKYLPISLDKQKRQYDKHAGAPRVFKEGDNVFYYYAPKDQKFTSRPWEQYIVVKVIPNEPRAVVYEISRGNLDTPRTVHIDNLRKWYGWQEIKKWWDEDVEQQAGAVQHIAGSSLPEDMDDIAKYLSLTEGTGSKGYQPPSLTQGYVPAPSLPPDWYTSGDKEVTNYLKRYREFGEYYCHQGPCPGSSSSSECSCE